MALTLRRPPVQLPGGLLLSCSNASRECASDCSCPDPRTRSTHACRVHGCGPVPIRTRVTTRARRGVRDGAATSSPAWMSGRCLANCWPCSSKRCGGRGTSPRHSSISWKRGAGNGMLASDVLDAARRDYPEFYAAIRLWLVERSVAARRAADDGTLVRHRARLAGYGPDLPSSGPRPRGAASPARRCPSPRTR